LNASGTVTSFAHAAVTGVQALRNFIQRGELWGVLALTIIGIVLIVLTPARQSTGHASVPGATKSAI